jgi:hypothetical protein
VVKSEVGAVGRIENQYGYVYMLRCKIWPWRKPNNLGSQQGQPFLLYHVLSMSYDLKVERKKMAGMEEKKEKVQDHVIHFPPWWTSEFRKLTL